MHSVLGSIYGKMADLRNALYERGVFKSADLGARTISVGNITAGGTGKTPLVMFISKILADRGENVCVLTRGYGRRDPKKRVLVSDGKQVLADALTGGDEPVEIAQRLLGQAIVVADPDRVAGAKWAIENYGVSAFVLDDAFQHRRAKRDLDIVCIDATSPLGGGRMLPAGRLREPLTNLKRADLIVLTRANLVDDIDSIQAKIGEYAPDTPIFTASSRTSKITPLTDVLSCSVNGSGNEKSTEDPDFSMAPAFAFTALGNPDAFFDQLRRDDILIAGTYSFDDHHYYVERDMNLIVKKARECRAIYLLTTGKDAAKLAGLKIELPCYVVESEITMDDQSGFTALL